METPIDNGDNKEFNDITDPSSVSTGASLSPARDLSVPAVPQSDEDDMENDGFKRRLNGQGNAHPEQQRLRDGAEQPQPPRYGAIPQQDEEQEVQEDCRALIRRYLRCRFPLCIKVLFILSVFFCILAVVAIVSLIVVYLEIRSKDHNVILSRADQNPQNIFVMANSTYKIDVSPLLFSGVRVSYNHSVNNTENEYTPPSLALVRQSCTKEFVNQSFEGHHETLKPSTAYCLLRHWPKGRQGLLTVITQVGEVWVFYNTTQDQYNKDKKCQSDSPVYVCQNTNTDQCDNKHVDVSEDVYIVPCAKVGNKTTTTSFYYELQEQQYNVSANDNTSILTPGDTFGIDVIFNSLVVEMLHPGMCTYLITMDSGSSLNYTTPVIVEALLPRWEDYILFCLCIVLSLVVLVATPFAVCFCHAYCCRRVAF